MAYLAEFFRHLVTNTSKEVDILRHDVAIFKNLIKERQHPLDLVRELLSNAGAKEVGATRIEIGYTRDEDGDVFSVSDNGCGMDFSGDQTQVSRLARFLGLGLSGIVGERSDEFSWKGLGSKLAYQSRRVVVETRSEGHPLYEVRIDEPWQSLDQKVIPKPRVVEHRGANTALGTRIKVFGHPPHRQEKPFTLEEIRRFLLHRTFAGYTKQRESCPQIVLSVLGETQQLGFGFPELNGHTIPAGLLLDTKRKTLFVNIAFGLETLMGVRLKGFLTWDAAPFGLAKDELNTGLILSSRGIPFCELAMDEYGVGKALKTSPGKARMCLVVECDDVYSEMSLSRSGLVDSPITVEFKKRLRQLFDHLENSIDYREFKQLRKKCEEDARGALIARDKQSMTADDQNWVMLEQEGADPRVLMREPSNETEAIAVLWKLESLGALPFAKFQTIGHPAASRTPDLFVNFQEEATTEPLTAAIFEAKNKFYSYKRPSRTPAQQPRVICWDAPSRGRKTRLNRTDKRYKFTVDTEHSRIPVYVMKQMDGLSVLSTRELRERGISI